MKSNKDTADMFLKYITESELCEFVHIYFDNICYYWEEEAQEHTIIYNIEAPVPSDKYSICIKIDLEVIYKLNNDLFVDKIESLERGFKYLGLEYEKYDILTFCII